MTPSEPPVVATEPAAAASEQLVRAMLRVTSRLMRLEAQSLSGLATPLTHRQFRILAKLGDGATSPTSISRQSNVSLAAITESIEALVQRGLVDRQPDSADGRAQRLALTPHGREAWLAAEGAITALCTLVASLVPTSVSPGSADAVDEVRLAIDGMTTAAGDRG